MEIPEYGLLDTSQVDMGAFDGEQVIEVLRLDEQYKPLYIMPIGKPA